VLFTEPTFLFLFLPVLLALYFVQRRSAHGVYANWLLLTASVLFYAKGGGAFTWLMLGSIGFNYWMALAVARARSTGTAATAALGVTIAVAVNLAVLGVFKYANFFADNANALLTRLQMPPVPVPQVLLPIGISFFTFHAISYVIDVYRRDATAQKSPVHAALYLLLFPQLIAGPIIRYRDIADQLAERRVSIGDFACGVRRFIIGLAKKVLVANVVAGPADAIFTMPLGQLSLGHAWLGLVCYTLQIYFDFSGYSDLAIGLGRMFGFRFPENFRWPYIASTVQGFWRRWHISLSTWFRDYLYVPLGGNRQSPARTYLNLVTVFLLCGLWHGASWTFVIWGLWHGVFLVIERLASSRGRAAWAHGSPVRRPESPMRAVSWPVWPHVYTLLVVMIGWVFFRADTVAGAMAFLKALAGGSPALPTTYTVQWYLTSEVRLAIIAGLIGSTPWVPALAARWSRAPRRAPGWTMPLVSTAALIALLVASILQVAARTYDPFIYFRF
jgi:alginate O-acetyltransferase complex protein AlgI